MCFYYELFVKFVIFKKKISDEIYSFFIKFKSFTPHVIIWIVIFLSEFSFICISVDYICRQFSIAQALFSQKMHAALQS